MLSHPMSLRSIIHLGLVGEMRMHNGKIPPHCRMEKEESNKRMPAEAVWIPASQRSRPGKAAGGGG